MADSAREPIRDHGPAPLQRWIGAAFVVASVVAIAAVALTPTSARTRFPILCITCGDRPAVDALLNILLFIPLGIGLGLLRVSLWRALFVGVGATLLIELLQYAVVSGRYPAARDALTNAFGALIGYGVGGAWRQVASPSRRTARIAFGTIATIWMATQTLTAWAMGFAPPPPTWWGQITPRHDRFPDVFAGRIVALSVGTLRIIENDTLTGVADLRGQLLDGAALCATVTEVRPSAGIAPIIIVASLPSDVISWSIDGTDAVFVAAVRGNFVGLRQPSVRLRDVVPSNPDDTLTLTGAYDAGRYRLTADVGGATRSRTLAASASFGWALAVPFPHYAFGEEVRAITGCWLGIIWVMLGFWARRATGAHPRWMIGASMLVVLTGLFVIPVSFGIPASHWTEWLACILASIVGWAGGDATPRPALGSGETTPELTRTAT